MIVTVWVLGSLLLGALLALFAFYGRLGNIERKLEASQSRVEGLRREVEYWIGLYDRAHKRNVKYRDALQNIVNMETPTMANIGSRMVRAARRGLAAIKQVQ